MFLGFFPFYFVIFSIRVRYLQKDTVRMIFPFFPFLFWRFWVCEGNTLMGYCRNDFSLFFPFSVFPSKIFFFYFFYFYFLCVIVLFGEKKKQKITFLGEKGKKGKNRQEIQQNTFVLYWKRENGIFPFFFRFSLFYSRDFLSIRKQKKRKERKRRHVFLYDIFFSIDTYCKN